MAKFKFYQDKQVTTFVRDYFNVEADSLEDAIEYVKSMNCSLEEEECKPNTKVEFVIRDVDWMHDCLVEVCDEGYPSLYSIYSCDLEDDGEMDSEIVATY